MTELIITRGPQASGKTTEARKWVAVDPVGRVRVNRDDIREMVNQYVFVAGKQGTEPLVQRLRNGAISTALLAGKSVICDDMNLDERTVRELHVLAITHGAEFKIWDMCGVPLEQCIRRDIARGLTGGRSLGEQVIRQTFQRAKLPAEGGTAPTWKPDTAVERIERYVPNSLRGKAIIVDIDGTLAIHVRRSPYNYDMLHTDAPNPAVITVVDALRHTGVNVIVASGRPDAYRAQTEVWLDTHVRDWDELYMRQSGDTRNDAVVKLEIFEAHIRNRFNVVGVFDDRDRVVRVWRALGLATFQVNDGAF